MANKLNFHQRIARIAGGFLIAAGLICNEWVLVKLFSPDGKLLHRNRIAIGIFEIVCLGFGLLFWRRKDLRILLKVGSSLVALLLVLFLLEKALAFRTPRLNIENPNGSGSYRLLPNLNVGNIQTNSHGMRWRKIKQEKANGVKRVAFLGDSFTFGCCADRVERSFVGIFDEQMRSKRVEALNFGVGGYGLADMYLLFQEDVLAFRPDFVFLIFFNGNDFSDTYLSLEGNHVLGNDERWARAKQKIPESFRDSRFDRTIQKARRTEFFSLILDVRENLHRKKGEYELAPLRDFYVSESFTSTAFWCKTDYPPIATQARDLSLQFMDRIRGLCEANGMQLVIASIPFYTQVYAREIAGPGYDIRYPQKYVEEFAHKHSIPYYDTLPAFRKYAQQSGRQLFVLDGHYNNEGHRIAGEALVKFFHELGAMKRSPRSPISLSVR